MASLVNSTVHVTPTIKLREQFVQDLNGTTMGEVMIFVSQIPLYIFVTIFFELCVLNTFNINAYKLNAISIYSVILVFIFEIFTMVVPVLMMFTVLSDFLNVLALSIVGIVFFIIINRVSSLNDCVYYWKLPQFKRAMLSENLFLEKTPFITYFRSFILIVTTISILGVDFHVYPRRFAKTETYGVSLMDLGVGLFIISNALVVKKNQIGQLRKTLRESSFLFVIGVIRYILIQRFDYQKHVTEYGTHWNFFITLSLVKLISYCLLKIPKINSFISGLSLMFLHQYLLSHSLESYVLSSEERKDLFSANREGIISLSGYVSLYLIGISISGIINYKEGQSTTINKIRTVVLLFTISVISLFISYYIDNTYFRISRRLANLPFITWITAVSFAVLTIALLVELLCIFFLPIQPRFKGKVYFLMTPALLESINYNGLLFFLMSNLFTGLINLYMDPLKLDTFNSMSILLVYMLVNCVIVFVLYISNVQINVW